MKATVKFVEDVPGGYKVIHDDDDCGRKFCVSFLSSFEDGDVECPECGTLIKRMTD